MTDSEHIIIYKSNLKLNAAVEYSDACCDRENDLMIHRIT